jgi:hypothetical protein
MPFGAYPSELALADLAGLLFSDGGGLPRPVSGREEDYTTRPRMSIMLTRSEVFYRNSESRLGYGRDAKGGT